MPVEGDSADSYIHHQLSDHKEGLKILNCAELHHLKQLLEAINHLSTAVDTSVKMMAL